jgi:lantibiotic biosynthesis protein
MRTNVQPCRNPGARQKQAGLWRPVLEGAERERALQTVREIAGCLHTWQQAADHLAAGGAGLANGAAGLAVFFAYLAEGLDEDCHEATARRLLDQAIRMAEAEPMPPSLYQGLAGIGWAAAHLCTRLHWLDLEATIAQIDETVCDHLAQPVWQEDYQLTGGLVGLGVYALERLPAPVAVDCLERVVGHLWATAERKPEGATWWRGPERLSLHALKKMPDGAYDLGLAEGVPGVMALLARACAAGIAVDQARPLLDDAARWVLAQEAPDGPPEGFPYCIRPNRPQRNWTRSSWAYGDPGVAVALLGAANCVGEPAWEERALAAALRATTRPPDRTRVFDAGLCIGAAGLGHLFNRLFQAWGEPRLADRSRFWFERALEMRRPGHGIAGYAAWMPDENDVDGWRDVPGIIAGAAGIALALLAAATPFEPSWDRMMLVDIPPRLVRSAYP